MAVADFRALRRLRGSRGERCGLCAAPIGDRHAHLLAPDRRVICACAACGLLFGDAKQHYRRMPSRVLRLAATAITPADWRSLGIPISLAFLYRRDSGEPAAIYPSAAGPVEAPLEPDLWARIAAGCPPLALMAPEVEGLLAQHTEARPGINRRVVRHYLASRERCLILTALLRRDWRGFSGGAAWAAVEEFFIALDQEAVDAPAEAERPR